MADNQFCKRRTVFIKKAFQGRFIASVLLLIVLFGLCSAAAIYWLISSDLATQTQSGHWNINNTWDRVGLSITVGNLVAIIVAGVPSIFVVLYRSHKIAGPLYRFEQTCKAISQGRFTEVIRLSARDQLQELAQSFTQMADSLNK